MKGEMATFELPGECGECAFPENVQRTRTQGGLEAS